MPEPTQIMFKYQELAEILVRHAGLTNGNWGIYVRFGLSASNVGPDDEHLVPAAIIPVEFGIQRFDKPCNLSVDASQVNPQKPAKGGHKKG